MTYTVIVLHRADRDLEICSEWIAERSRPGLVACLAAFEDLLDRLADHADSFPVAQENDDFEIVLRQAFFKTRHGRTYRAVFTITGVHVRVLRVRGPGQPPLESDEIL